MRDKERLSLPSTRYLSVRASFLAASFIVGKERIPYATSSHNVGIVKVGCKIIQKCHKSSIHYLLVFGVWEYELLKFLRNWATGTVGSSVCSKASGSYTIADLPSSDIFGAGIEDTGEETEEDVLRMGVS